MKFKYRTIKHMAPREGVKYSTDYYKQSPHEYSRVDQHARSVFEQVVCAADREGLLDELETPLSGFPRTKKQPNYSALDIMRDMIDQLDHERDIPSGMLGRWNRLFQDNEEFQIEMEEDKKPNPLFNQMFYGDKS